MSVGGNFTPLFNFDNPPNSVTSESTPRCRILSGLTPPRMASRSQPSPKPVTPSIFQYIMENDTTNDFEIPKIPGTPLQIPNIGRRPVPVSTRTEEEKTTQKTVIVPNDLDVWMQEVTTGASQIKIAAITPVGTIALVPTIDKNTYKRKKYVPFTPSRAINANVVHDENEEKHDPILSATIYLDYTKAEDQAYDHVANKMRAIAIKTNNLRKQYRNELRDMIAVSGIVSTKKFEKILAIYENNQVYYQDCMDNNELDIEVIKSKLTELERWFMKVIEPKPTDDIEAWHERQNFKAQRGISAYCDPNLHKYITPWL